MMGTSVACREGDHRRCGDAECGCPCHVPFAGHPEPLCLATDEDPFCRRHPWSLWHVDAFTSSHALRLELDRLDAVPLHALPPSPLCERCEHQLCQCCPGPWCDRINCTCYEDHDGECIVLPEDWRAWRRQVDACELDSDRVGDHCTTLQDGPWWPWKGRQ